MKFLANLQASNGVDIKICANALDYSTTYWGSDWFSPDCGAQYSCIPVPKSLMHKLDAAAGVNDFVGGDNLLSSLCLLNTPTANYHTVQAYVCLLIPSLGGGGGSLRNIAFFDKLPSNLVAESGLYHCDFRSTQPAMSGCLYLFSNIVKIMAALIPCVFFWVQMQRLGWVCVL